MFPPMQNAGPTRRSNAGSAQGQQQQQQQQQHHQQFLAQPPQMGQKRSNVGVNVNQPYSNNYSSGPNQSQQAHQPPSMRSINSSSGGGSQGFANYSQNQPYNQFSPSQPPQQQFQPGQSYGYPSSNNPNVNAGYTAGGFNAPQSTSAPFVAPNLNNGQGMGGSNAMMGGGMGMMGGQPGFQNNNFGGGAFGVEQFAQFQNSAAGQLGMQLGSEALKQGQTIVNQNINRYVNIPKLKYYFNVSNSYVLNKLRVLVFSFRQKSWTRTVVRSENNGQMEGFKPPREDLNAPDLYIPIMAFVTYVLMVGVTLNFRKKFEPEVLGLTSSTALIIILFEVLSFKLGCYLLNVTTDIPFFDLIAYCGYKFVPVLIALSVSLITPAPAVVYSLLAYLIISYSFFTLRSVKYLVLPDTSTSSTLVASQRQQRIYLLFLFTGFQAISSFFLFYF